MPRRSLIPLITALALVAAAAPPYKERWVPKYFYDEDGSSLMITDLQFPTPKRGIAAGVIAKRDAKDKPVVLVTTDAGEHWTLTPVKEAPISLFVLEDGTGWMVGEKNIWKTEESGRSWQKINNSPKDILRVWFSNRNRGWAVGGQKQVLQTSDGGATWTPVAAAAIPKLNPETTVYSAIAFGNANDGVIAGWSNPLRRGELPSWVDPERAKDRPQWPNAMALLQTRDGGVTWQTETASIFGHMTKISLAPDSRSLGLVEFTDGFTYPSEVYLAGAGKGGKNQRVFRQANRHITDLLLTSSGTAYLAGSEATGTVRNSPVPGKLKILKSTDFQNWTEMPVDYRADAHRAIIASPDEDNVWVATDTGMILKLIRQP